jgi:hypothetical protein
LVKARGTDSAQLIEVILTEALRGDGTENSPCRIVRQYWGKDGKLLAEDDTYLSMIIDYIKSQLSSLQDGNTDYIKIGRKNAYSELLSFIGKM